MTSTNREYRVVHDRDKQSSILDSLLKPATPSQSSLARRSSPHVLTAQTTTSGNGKQPSPHPSSPSGTTPFPRRRRRKRRVGSKEKRSNTCQYKIIWTITWILVVLGCVLKKAVVQNIHLRSRGRHHDDSTRILANQEGRNLETHKRNETFLDWEFGDIVHVIQTRLMQQQPDLIHLGMARLEIFEHFCLPTLVNQTSQNFLWIIRTDPDLNSALKERLLSLLQPHAHYLVVASNANPEGFRDDNGLDFGPDRVWSGSFALAELYHREAKRRIVLESRLDADDGLHRGFVENLQQESLVLLQERHDVSRKKWIIFCAYSHLEWQPSSPWTTGDDKDEDVPSGYWIAVSRPDCVTPGLTTGYGLNASRQDLPPLQHAKLHHLVPSCGDSKKSQCLARFGRLYPGTVRARTPTSAGMNSVIIGRHGNRKAYQKAHPQLGHQDLLWKGVQQSFGITEHDTTKIRSHLIQHLIPIAIDNLHGQCTKGHSCKTKSEKMLKAIIATGRDRDSPT